jgi:protein-arginine kinase activator protein McsA
MGKERICELCGGKDPLKGDGAGKRWSEHHLIPRTVQSNKWFKKMYSREQMVQKILVCRTCHHAIHDIVPDEKKLARNYNTLDKLLSHPAILRHVLWMNKRNAK